MTTASSPTVAGAVVLDASVAVAIVSKETDRDTRASAELARYSGLGYQWYAPGAIITETLLYAASAMKGCWTRLSTPRPSRTLLR